MPIKELFVKAIKSIAYKKGIILSDSGIVLYNILCDHRSLSEKNNWKLKTGEYYIKLSYERIMEIIKHARATVAKLLKELEDAGLIRRIRRGQGKCNLIIVNIPADPKEVPTKKSEFEEKAIQDFEKELHVIEERNTKENNAFRSPNASAAKKLPAKKGDTLTKEEYVLLTQAYGKDAVDMQIEKIERNHYKNCKNYETINNWCAEAVTRFQKKKVKMEGFAHPGKFPFFFRIFSMDLLGRKLLLPFHMVHQIIHFKNFHIVINKNALISFSIGKILQIKTNRSVD